MGTTGRIEIEIPVNTLADVAARMSLFKGSSCECIDLPVCDQYTLQGSAFAQAIVSGGEVPVSLQDAINNMRVVEAALSSHQQGGWVSLNSH